MFFRREKTAEPSFEDRLQSARQEGFSAQSQPDGRVLVSRAGCGAMLRHHDGRIEVERAGWLIDGAVAALVDAGYQKYWRVGEQRRAPALANQLKAVHSFEEDLREALGLKSLYNISLGTTNDLHLYDRVEGREDGSRRPWQR